MRKLIVAIVCSCFISSAIADTKVFVSAAYKYSDSRFKDIELFKIRTKANHFTLKIDNDITSKLVFRNEFRYKKLDNFLDNELFKSNIFDYKASFRYSITDKLTAIMQVKTSQKKNLCALDNSIKFKVEYQIL